jgi:hypothetical protein
MAFWVFTLSSMVDLFQCFNIETNKPIIIIITRHKNPKDHHKNLKTYFLLAVCVKSCKLYVISAGQQATFQHHLAVSYWN